MSEQPKEEIGWGPEGSQALDVLSSEFEMPSSYQPGNSPIPEFSSFSGGFYTWAWFIKPPLSSDQVISSPSSLPAGQVVGLKVPVFSLIIWMVPLATNPIFRSFLKIASLI